MLTLEDRIVALEARLEEAESIISRLSKLVLDGALSTISAPFRVVNHNGELLLEVSNNEKGTESHLRIFNRKGEAVAALGSDVDGGNLVIRDNAGKIVSYLHIGSDGARFSLDASASLAGIDFYTNESGAGLVISNNKGKGSAELYADVQTGVIVLRDGKEVPIVVLPNNA